MSGESDSRPIENRYEFVLFFDVTNGNPNGDPDAGNMPRTDPESGHGLLTDGCVKRKVRDYVAMVREGEPGMAIYVARGIALNSQQALAWESLMPEADAKAREKAPKDVEKARDLTRWMCANFFDVRTFGGMMETKVNVGSTRGPVQIAFATSVEPVLPVEVAITRITTTTEADLEAKGGRGMGAKHIVPYGLYRMHGYVSAPLASHPVKGTGFSEADLELLWQALMNMWDHDRSSARGEMAGRKLVIFRHDSKYGSAPAQSLFDRVVTKRVTEDGAVDLGGAAARALPAARHWRDYEVIIDEVGLPAGVSVEIR